MSNIEWPGAMYIIVHQAAELTPDETTLIEATKLLAQRSPEAGKAVADSGLTEKDLGLAAMLDRAGAEKITDSTWLFHGKSGGMAVKLRDWIMPFLRKNDDLLVVEFSANPRSWASYNLDAWPPSS